MPYNFTSVEKKWQRYWLEHKSFRALDPAEAGQMPKAYVLDMFPYPSGAGLHVGHPEGYTATDIVSRYLRMRGHNVLHPMGWDAFGLPAEQYAIKHGVHPRDTTQTNINNFRRQIQMLGLSYDWDREVDTTDPGYYKWTQWIFLQLFNSYFDPVEQKAKPIGHLMQELVNENYVVAPDGEIKLNPTQEGLEQVAGEMRIERLWRELSPQEQHEAIDTQRLAYIDEVPVNWCPGLGTVLANEEVIDGKSEVGGFPVERRPMRQWMLRITAYADRLAQDLDLLNWPESLKEMQRNWIGKSVGADVDFELAEGPAGLSPDKSAQILPDPEPDVITVFTTRPDTLYGATYMVLAPEHPLVNVITTSEQWQAVDAYRAAAAARSDRDRMADAKEKTGVFTGAYAINPLNDERIPVWIADYVLTGYGTGAIMAVPAHDERDFEFAKKFNLPIRAVVMPTVEWLKQREREIMRDALRGYDRGAHQAAVVESMRKQGFDIRSDALRSLDMRQVEPMLAERHASSQFDDELISDYRENPIAYGEAFTGEGVAVNSPAVDGLPTQQAKDKIIDHLEDAGIGRRSVKYKLRDWLFSRQRYWGEPFPIVFDAGGNPQALPESALPVTLPEMSDFKPTGTPEPPLSKAKGWATGFSIDGEPFTRETNTMPQWAGSCWYYLRYIDPNNEERFIDPEKERYWLPVDLYVGGAEHAVLHLLYSRFWHKVLYDLGHVSTAEPFTRLVNQGIILGEEFYITPTVFQAAQADLERAGIVAVFRKAEDEGKEGIYALKIKDADGELVNVPENQISREKGKVYLENPRIEVTAKAEKMSKSRGNVVNPDDIVRDYGADAFRLYEMYMGPLEAQKPWSTRDIVGMSRFLNGVWRNFVGDEEAGKVATIADAPIPDALDRQLHRTIKKVGDDIDGLRFNTAIAELIKLNNSVTGLPAVPRALAEPFALLLAPFAPHLAEELWQRLGHGESLARHPWPTYDPTKLTESSMELPVQVNGKVRDKITVPADADEATILAAAESSEKVRPWLDGKTMKKRLYVPKKLVNFVVG